MALTIKPYLRVYTGSDMHYRFDDELEEWYNDRDMRYFDFDRYDYSDEESEEEEDFVYDNRTSSQTRIEETHTHDEATSNSKQPHNTVHDQTESTTEDARTKDVNTQLNTPTAFQAQTQTQTQTQIQYDLSYYGYGDYDFDQLSRTTTAAFNIYDFMDPNPVSAVEDRENEGDDEEEEDADDTDDMRMANRHWHCPQPQR
jgi:hypothetical protein